MESILSQAPLVAQLYVHGDSTEDKLVAIAVPDEEAVALWLKTSGTSAEGGVEEDLESAILSQMKEVGRQSGLKGYELIYGGIALPVTSQILFLPYSVLFLPYSVLFCPARSLVLSYPVLSCPIISCPVFSYLFLSYSFLPCLLSCPVLFCHDPRSPPVDELGSTIQADLT